MPWVEQEDLAKARELDLLPYLQAFEPDELVRLSSNVYSTKSYSSLKISNGLWIRWAGDSGGRSALDYLVKVRGMAVPEAALHILKCLHREPHTPLKDERASAREEAKPIFKDGFKLPPRHENNKQVVGYLLSRGIHPRLINHCIKHGHLYETVTSNGCHNAVFVGRDNAGIPRYATQRGTGHKKWRGDIANSDKRYGFKLRVNGAKTVHLFESAIEVLSYLTNQIMTKGEWQNDDYIALCGVYLPRKKINETTMPMALEQYLKDKPGIEHVVVQLNGDNGGEKAAETIKVLLAPHGYKVDIDLPPRGKDYNDLLPKPFPRLRSMDCSR